MHAVSNRNCILEAGRSSAVVRTFAADEMRDRYRRQRPDGSGDLVLQRRLRLEKTKRGTRGPGPQVQIAEEEVSFMGVQDVRGAERCIRALERGASQGTQAPRKSPLRPPGIESQFHFTAKRSPRARLRRQLKRSV